MRGSMLLGMGACLGVFATGVLPAASLAAEKGLPDLCGRLAKDNIRFVIYGGRVQATANQGGIESSTTTNLGLTEHETLNVQTTENAELSLEYELVSHIDSLKVSIGVGGALLVERRHSVGDSETTVRFEQPPTTSGSPITLAVTEKGKYASSSAPTLWHLLLSKPELCAKHLLPLLSMFRPDWKLNDTATAMETQMLRLASYYSPENLAQWSQWVGQLASDKFATRQAAERQLRAVGPAAVAYLSTLDRKRLDYEQWSRISAIQSKDASSDEDTPVNSCCELMTDREIWLTLLDRPQQATRETAARQLSFLAGKAIKFDAAASDAARHEQIEVLRAELSPGGRAD